MKRIFRLFKLSLYSFAELKSVKGNKPPITSDTSEGRYASALFSSASENQCLDLVMKDIRYIKNMLKNNVIIQNFISDISFKGNDQIQVFLLPLKEKIHQITFQLMKAIIEAHRQNKITRLHEMPKVFEKYQNFYKIVAKEQDVKVVSAKALSDEQKAELRQALIKNKGVSEFKIQYEIDESLLGGLQIFSGSTYLDCSLRSRIQKIRQEIKKII